MDRYKWNFNKCLQFIDNKWANLEISKKLYMELWKITTKFEKEINTSSDWVRTFLAPKEYRNEEIILRNTFLNSSKFIKKRDFNKYKLEKSQKSFY